MAMIKETFVSFGQWKAGPVSNCNGNWTAKKGYQIHSLDKFHMIKSRPYSKNMGTWALILEYLGK